VRMFKYIARIYLRYFFIITFALSFLFAGLDYLQNANKLAGTNIKVLYLFYKGLYAMELLLPLSIVFAMIVTKIILIRSNALLSFYAFGYSKKAVITPFLAVATVLTLGYVGLHFTSFVDADLSAKRLLKGKTGTEPKRDLFVKYNDSFVYIGELIPQKKEARNIRTFQLKNGELVRIVHGQEAYFNRDRWVIKEAKIIDKPSPHGLGTRGFVTRIKKDFVTLEGFKPAILTSVFEGKRYYTILAAYQAIQLLKAQGLETLKVRNLFYHLTVTPFFAVFLVVILFVFIPPYARNLNLVWLSFVLTGITLFTWGILYFLFRIGRTGVIQPEFGTVAVVSVLGLGALYAYFFKTNRF